MFRGTRTPLLAALAVPDWMSPYRIMSSCSSSCSLSSITVFSIFLLDPRDEHKWNERWWQHRAKASNCDGVSWSLIYRVVKSSVRVTPEGKLWDPHSLGPKKDKDMQKKRKQQE